MKKIKAICTEFMQSFDSIAVGIVDFKTSQFDCFQETPFGKGQVFFDLASLTKPLTNGLAYLDDPESFNDKLDLLLNHKAGLPSWRRLSQKEWRDEVLSYDIKPSETLYSDLSAIRLMLEIEKKRKKDLVDICRPYWDNELVFWKDLPEDSYSPITGERFSSEIMGVVHDDNAFTMNSFSAHSGLFGTIEGICKSLIKIDKKLQLINSIEKEWDEIPTEQRFIKGWDRVQSHDETLAGNLCGKKTFGHLGFTGTSIWIDCQKRLGVVILSNATQKFWYDKDDINQLRKRVANYVWQR